MKKVLLGFAAGVMVTAATTAAASGGMEEITAYLKKEWPITLDGKELKLDQPAVVYDGHTYLPLREMMSYFGKDVQWDSDAGQVKLRSVTDRDVTAMTPDGKYIILGAQSPTLYKDAEIMIGWQIDPPDYVSFPNHSLVGPKEELELPVGQATLVRIEHGTSAALEQEGAKPEIVYWIYVTRPTPDDQAKVNTVYLQATVTGDENAAKEQLLEIAKSWKVPAEMKS